MRIRTRHLRENEKYRQSAERESAKALDMKLHRNSGALEWEKGDFSNDLFLTEHKSTTSHLIRLTNKVVFKCMEEARGYCKKPLIVVTFVKSDGKPVNEKARILFFREKDLHQVFVKTREDRFVLKFLRVNKKSLSLTLNQTIHFSKKDHLYLANSSSLRVGNWLGIHENLYQEAMNVFRKEAAT